MSVTIPQAPYQWQPNDVWEGIDVAHLHHHTCIAKKNQHRSCFWRKQQLRVYVVKKNWS